LSRSEEKSTQTLPVKSKGATVNHRSVAVQCEIWSTNPFGKLSEDKGSITAQIQDGKIMKATCQDRDIETHSSGDSGLLGANTSADCEQNVLKGDQDKNTKTRLSHNSELPGEICETNADVKPSNSRVPTPPILDIPTNCLDNTIVRNDPAFLETTKEPERKRSNQLLQPVGYSAENIIPDTPLILTENTDTVIHENKFSGSSTNTSANTTITDVQSSDPVTTEQNIIETNTNASSVEITTEIAVSDNKVKTLSPQHNIMPNISNADVQNGDMVTTEHSSTQDKIEKVVSSVETSTEITTTESKVKALSPRHADKTTIATDQTDKTMNHYGEPGQNTNPNSETDTPTTLHGDTDTLTTVNGEGHTIPTGKTNKTTMPHGETDKTTTNTVQNWEGLLDTIPNPNSRQHDSD
jgi:hypothetical protein